MSGFALHPEAYDDIDEIRAYIADDNPDAADRMVNEIFDRIRQLIPFPNQGLRRTNLTPLPLRFVPVREPDRVRSREKAVVGCRSLSWSPKPTGNRRHPARERIARKLGIAVLGLCPILSEFCPCQRGFEFPRRKSILCVRFSSGVLSFVSEGPWWGAGTPPAISEHSRFSTAILCDICPCARNFKRAIMDQAVKVRRRPRWAAL
jgi:plasmid stabilization system protein ParE